jgi:hypothetical protein|nr:MAG TPA: Spore coat protein H kinase fold, TRANSFERASE [Caudoviricetes sp.]
MPTFRQDEKLGTKVPLIKTADFNDKSVTTEKLAEGSVTNSKLAPESVTQDKFDKELLQIFKAAAGLPENLIETIQNVDSTLVDHQWQISSNDDDISDLQTKTKQIKDTVDGIAISGGASVGSAVTYDNTQSGLDAQNIQNAIDELVNNLGHYETNEEWLRAYTDTENKFLWGIRVDGSIEWAVGIPRPIQEKIEELIATDTAIQESITQLHTELTESLNNKIQSLKDNEIKNLQDTKVDKKEGQSLIEDEVKECFRVIENEEFIKAIVDADDKVLFGFYRATGKPYYPLNETYHVIQNEEFLWVILDAANHPLLGIKQDGTCWAAKAQWLDDIKAIKKALSSIDETLKTFQPKEDGKGLINLDVADSFFYISNDEYIIAVVDAENRILAGIKYDGEPYFPNHEMYSVITNEEWLYAIIDAENKVLGGFRADDGHMVVGGIDINTFIANAIIDIADIKERTTHLSTIVNDEYLSVETDAEGKVIGYTASDGSHYLYKVKSETIPTEFEHIEDPEGRMEIATDAEGKVLSYRDAEGKKHEYDMEVAKLDVSNLNLQGDSVNDIQEALNSNGFNAKTPIDWSNNSFIQIPEPYLAKINLTNINAMPTSKTDDFHAWLEFWDMQGNYFKKRVILNAQGNSSLQYVKKNFAADFCNDEWVGDDTFFIRIGAWVAQDSFHFKAYYSPDVFKGVCPVSYKFMDEIVKTRGIIKDRQWKRCLLPTEETIGVNPTNLENASIKTLLDDGARGFPDGFPCIVYLNDSFYGIFSWQLKKHRDNMHQDKGNASHIHLDGNISSQTITLADGSLNWDIINGKTPVGSDNNIDGIEIRNPKSLICIDGSKYDGDDNRKELIDEESPSYDSTNKNHLNTAKVKTSLIKFSTYIPNLKRAESEGKSESEIKNMIMQYFETDSIIDYIIFSDVINNRDGFRKNWQWVSYDGNKFGVEVYDTDQILGSSGEGIISGHLGNTLDLPTGWIIKYMSKELESRYKVLRDENVISAKNITNLLSNWCSRIGIENYKKEYNKWENSNVNDNIYRVSLWLDKNIAECDKIFKYL